MLAGFGAAGVIARYGSDEFFRRQVIFPFSTFVVNLIGSAAAGFFFGHFSQRATMSDPLKIAVMTGFLGGFTTFSALSLQSLQMLQQKQYLLAVFYLVGSPLLGLGMAWLGFLASRTV